jgi:Transposase IS66 family
LTKVAVVEIDDAVIDRFGRHRCRCPGIRQVKGVSEKYVKRAPRFVEFLSERGIVRSKPQSTSPAFDRHVIEFQEWLRQHRGITELTIGRHGRMVMRLLPALSRKPRSWNAQLIRDVILAETRRVSLAYVKTMTMALRGYADWVGSASATLMPLVDTIRAHVFVAERIHADDTTVPVLAKGKTRTAAYGLTFATTGPLPGPIRRRRYSSIRAIGAASIPSVIWPATPD